MKKVKAIIIFFIMMLCLVLNGELYQEYLTNFTNQFWYFEVAITDADEVEGMMEWVQELLVEHEMGGMTVSKETKGSRKVQVTVFADDIFQQILREKYYIKEGCYQSVFSGQTDIVITDWSNWVPQNKEVVLYFTGSKEQVQSLKNQFNTRYASSYMHREKTKSQQWLALSLWGIAGVLICLITWMDIQFQKKENFILLSLGSSKWKLIWKNIWIDAVIIVGIYGGLFYLLRQLTTVEYLWRSEVAIGVGIVLINAALYFNMLRYQFREVLEGANINSGTVANCYLLKVFTTVILIVSFSTYIMIIQKNYSALQQYKELDSYQDYQFIHMGVKSDALEGTEDLIEILNNKLLYYSYKIDRTAMSVIALGEDTRNIVIVNRNASSLIKNVPQLEELDKRKAYHIFIPEEVKDTSKMTEEAVTAVSTGIGITEEAEYDVISYTTQAEVLVFDDNESMGAALGYGVEKNPIIVFLEKGLEEGEHLEWEEFDASFLNQIMFQISQKELADFSDKYNLEEKGIRIYTEKVQERFQQYLGEVERLILLNSIISIFLLLLELLIISVITKMEYMVNAKQLAIKKILGYSIFRKNRLIIGLNIAANVIGIGTMLVVSFMYQVLNWYIILVVGAALAVVELSFIICNIWHFEAIHITKILKGGSL